MEFKTNVAESFSKVKTDMFSLWTSVHEMQNKVDLITDKMKFVENVNESISDLEIEELKLRLDVIEKRLEKIEMMVHE